MRSAEIVRETKETKVRLAVNLDGTGKATIATGIGFFDHMLDLL
ncbi:MAG: imidazoleglycerol-phosphate dehydratase, partial [Azorhizobium sp. 35-67-5]